MWRDERWAADRLAEDSGEADADLMRWAATTSSHEVSNILLSVLRRYPPGTASGLISLGALVHHL